MFSDSGGLPARPPPGDAVWTERRAGPSPADRLPPLSSAPAPGRQCGHGSMQPDDQCFPAGSHHLRTAPCGGAGGGGSPQAIPLGSPSRSTGSACSGSEGLRHGSQGWWREHLSPRGALSTPVGLADAVTPPSRASESPGGVSLHCWAPATVIRVCPLPVAPRYPSLPAKPAAFRSVIQSTSGCVAGGDSAGSGSVLA